MRVSRGLRGERGNCPSASAFDTQIVDSTHDPHKTVFAPVGAPRVAHDPVRARKQAAPATVTATVAERCRGANAASRRGVCSHGDGVRGAQRITTQLCARQCGFGGGGSDSGGDPAQTTRPNTAVRLRARARRRHPGTHIESCATSADSVDRHCHETVCQGDCNSERGRRGGHGMGPVPQAALASRSPWGAGPECGLCWRLDVRAHHDASSRSSLSRSNSGIALQRCQ